MLLHFMKCHSKKCIAPAPQAATHNIEVELNIGQPSSLPGLSTAAASCISLEAEE